VSRHGHLEGLWALFPVFVSHIHPLILYCLCLFLFLWAHFWIVQSVSHTVDSTFLPSWHSRLIVSFNPKTPSPIYLLFFSFHQSHPKLYLASPLDLQVSSQSLSVWPASYSQTSLKLFWHQTWPHSQSCAPIGRTALLSSLGAPAGFLETPSSLCTHAEFHWIAARDAWTLLHGLRNPRWPALQVSILGLISESLLLLDGAIMKVLCLHYRIQSVS
jgi:hypothetical protein